MSTVLKGKASRSAAASLTLVMAVTVLGAHFVLSVASLEHYSFVSTSANERISRSLDIAVEHTNKEFEEIEILLATVDGMTRQHNTETLKDDQAHLHDRLKDMIGKAPDLRAIWLSDRVGRPLVTSSVFPAPDLDNSDRDYFIAQQDPKAGRFIEKILIPKIGGHSSFR